MILNNWLYIEPFVHISSCVNKVLLYNTLNGKALEYNNLNSVFNLIKRIESNKNLLVVNLRPMDLNNSDIHDFIIKLKINFMGGTINSPTSVNRPIQIKPIFNIQKDIRVLSASKDISIGTRVMQNITETTIYINSLCKLNCTNCFKSNKQFHWCTKYKNQNIELGIKYIKNIINDLASSNLKKLNIVGGNILLHPDIKKIFDLLKDCPFIVEFHVYYKNFKKEEFNELLSNPNFCLKILIDSPIDVDILSSIKAFQLNNSFKTHYSFSVENIDHVSEVEECFGKLDIEDYSILPFFNKKNLSFFKKNVFYNKKDLYDTKPSITDIHTAQVINSNYFGKLNIMCDGSIFANTNEKTLGNIESSSLHKATYSEIRGNKSWRKTRNKIVPCRKCVYKHICPPISNYEYALNSYSLCNIVK